MKVLREDTGYEMCNRQVLFATRRAMALKHKKRQARLEQRRARGKEEEDAAGAGQSGESDGTDGESGRGAGDSDENDDPGAEVRKAWHTDGEPGLDDGLGDGAGARERWAGLSAEERLSAAPPAPAAQDCVQGAGAAEAGSTRFGGLLNPPGFDSEVLKFVKTGITKYIKETKDE